MPSVYALKPTFQKALRPLCEDLARARITPNQITVTAVALSVGVGALLAALPGHPTLLLLLPVTLFLRMALNALDGMLARGSGRVTALGTFLNEIGDAVSDAALYLPLALVPGLDPRLVVAAVVLALLTEVAGLAAVQVGASRRCDGPMGKSDRALLFGVLALALGLGAPAATWGNGLVGLGLILMPATLVGRVRAALREVA